MNDRYEISRNTAVASMTALRQFYRALELDLKQYEKTPNCQTMIESVLRFRKLVKTAYNELQSKTNINTPLDIQKD